MSLSEHSSPRIVAAFDFDRTLTTVDTLSMFFRIHAGKVRFMRVVARRAPRLVMSLVLGGGARDNAKAAMAFSILKGCPEEEVNRSAKVVAQTVLRGNLRPDVVRRVRWHQREGHKVVIVSASFEAYVRIVASELGIKDVLATSWEVEDGHLTGKLAGANVRGPEKATRLLAALSPGERVCWAYGDSAGDREMLALAERPLLVEPRHPVPDFATQGVVE